LAGERSFGNAVNKGMVVSVRMWWYGVPDDGWEG